MHWHELRRTHIGASEIGALCGDKAFTTPHEIWARMRGLFTGTHESDFLEFGNDMEPIIAKYLARTYQLEIQQAREYHIHPKYPWLGCTPDYYITNSEHGKAGLQIKHVSGDWVDGWTRETAPAYIEWQVAQEQMIVNATLQEYGLDPVERWYIGAMIGGNVSDLRLMERRLTRDKEEEIIDRSSAFMDMVARGEPPVDNPRDVEHLREMFAACKLFEESHDLRAEADAVEADIATFLEAQAEESSAAKRKERAKARLMRRCMVFDDEDVLGHTVGETDGWEIHMNIKEEYHREREARMIEKMRFSVKRKKRKKHG
jgi:predicted phage-related endonuclease